MSVTINHEQKVAYGLLIGTDLNDLEQHNSPYFAYFHQFDSFAGQLCHSG